MTIMTSEMEAGVADVKARFSEVLSSVALGAHVLITKRGKPIAALVPPGDVVAPTPAHLGLAAFAGALADWEDLPEAMEGIAAARGRAVDRPAPDLD